MNELLGNNDQESVEEILKAGRHLIELINEILDISGIDSGQMTLSVTPVSVSESLEEALSLIETLARDRNVKLQWTAPPGPQLACAGRCPAAQAGVLEPPFQRG